MIGTQRGYVDVSSFDDGSGYPPCDFGVEMFFTPDANQTVVATATHVMSAAFPHTLQVRSGEDLPEPVTYNQEFPAPPRNLFSRQMDVNVEVAEGDTANVLVSRTETAPGILNITVAPMPDA